MLNRSEVMIALNRLYGDKLKEMGFFCNKNMTIYKLKNEMGNFKFYFNFDKKNTLHLQFSYTHPILGKRMIEIENLIREEKKLSKSSTLSKVKSRPTITITDWLDCLSNNHLDIEIYNKWFFKLGSLEDVSLSKNTYEMLFHLVEENIIKKVTSNGSLYEYLKNIDHKSYRDFQNLLILGSLIDDTDIHELYQNIKNTNSYKNMIETFSKNVDLTFSLLVKNQ